MLYAYAKIESGKVVEYPIFQGDLQNEYPDVTLPPAGYVEVEDVLPPTTGAYEYIIDDTPVNVDGVWARVFKVVKHSEDFVWDEIRKTRNEKLIASDWTQLLDSPLKGNEEWLRYRQALRDITLQPDPYNIVWPVEPQIV